MKIIRVLFYNYVRWFRRVQFAKSRIISSAFCFFGIILVIAICAIMDIVVQYHHYEMDKAIRTDFIAFIALIVFGGLYFILLYDGRSKKIIDAQPKFFNSDDISAIITFVFTLVCLSTILPLVL